MSILVVGSVAFDSVKTPFGEAKEILGGSASYFSISASFFSPVSLVAVVGNDFPQEHLDLFEKFAVDTRGLQRVAGKTFRWTGEYGFALNEAKTLDTQLNVFESFKPEIPVGYRNCQYVFLGNIDPVLQRQVLCPGQQAEVCRMRHDELLDQLKAGRVEEDFGSRGYSDY